jgi:hypothetical protein
LIVVIKMRRVRVASRNVCLRKPAHRFRYSSDSPRFIQRVNWCGRRLSYSSKG